MDDKTDRDRSEVRPRGPTSSGPGRGMRHELVVHGTRFTVPGDDVDRVEAEILAAVRNGGAFVRLRTSALVDTELLVTAATPIRLEHIADEPSSSPAGPAASGDTDDDAFLDHPLWYDFDEL